MECGVWVETLVISVLIPSTSSRNPLQLLCRIQLPGYHKPYKWGKTKGGRSTDLLCDPIFRLLRGRLLTICLPAFQKWWISYGRKWFEQIQRLVFSLFRTGFTLLMRSEDPVTTSFLKLFRQLSGAAGNPFMTRR